LHKNRDKKGGEKSILFILSRLAKNRKRCHLAEGRKKRKGKKRKTPQRMRNQGYEGSHLSNIFLGGGGKRKRYPTILCGEGFKGRKMSDLGKAGDLLFLRKKKGGGSSKMANRERSLT